MQKVFIVFLYFLFLSTSFALTNPLVPELAIGYWKKDTASKTWYPLLAVSTDPDKINWSYASDMYTRVPNHRGKLSWSGCNETFCVAGGNFSNSKEWEAMLAVSTDRDRLRWNYISIPTPPNYNNDLTLRKIKCTSSMCVAGLSYNVKDQKEVHGVYFASADSSSPDQWSAAEMHFSPEIPKNITIKLDDFDCSGEFCLASFMLFNNPGKIFFARSLDRAKTWSVISEAPTPSDEQGKLYLYGYKSQVKCHKQACIATQFYTQTGKVKDRTMSPWVFYSGDQGKSWSATKIPVEREPSMIVPLSLLFSNDTWIIKGLGPRVGEQYTRTLFTFMNADNGKPSSWVYRAYEGVEAMDDSSSETADCKDNLCIFTVEPHPAFPDLMIGENSGKEWHWTFLKNPLDVEISIGKISCEDNEHCTIQGSYPYYSSEEPFKTFLFRMTKGAIGQWTFTSLGENINNLPPDFFQGRFLYRYDSTKK